MAWFHDPFHAAFLQLGVTLLLVLGFLLRQAHRARIRTQMREEVWMAQQLRENHEMDEMQFHNVLKKYLSLYP